MVCVEERMFVLEPLTEILPNLIHPVLLKSMMELKREVSDRLNVELLDE